MTNLTLPVSGRIIRTLVDDAPISEAIVRPIAPIVQYKQSILPDSSGTKTIQLKLYLKDNLAPNHRTNDRLVRQWRQIPESFAPNRQAIKMRLRAIGKELARYKALDDVDGALEYVNSEQYQWRDHFSASDIFETIFGGDWFICNDCDVLEYYENGNTCYDDYRVCESCISAYRYSDYQDTYISEDDWYDEQDENGDGSEDDDEDNGSIGSYHSSKRHLGKIPSSFDQHKKPIYLGLELEMEIKDDYDRHDKAQQLLDAIGIAQIDGRNYQYALCEGDGSLNHGFEMVTGWTGLDTHAKQLEFFKTPFRGAKSHDTQTCGLHVHICKSDMSLLHCAKMVLFINESANQKLVRAIARREGASYSKILNKKASYQWLKNGKGSSKERRIQSLNGDRYEALNFQNEKTIEFRIFKGTLKYESIMASLEFAYATWWFCKDTGSNDLTISHFLEFISEPENKKHTRYLRAYLKEKGFNIPIKGIIKTNPRLEKTSIVNIADQLASTEI
jgi:hypothetical protein